jgi:D-alanine-D-alanine ligase
MVEYTLRALRSARKLSRTSVGVLLYCDEGADAGRSAALIRQAAAKARQVFVLRPGTPEDGVITSRHGYRKYRLTIQGDQLRAGRNHGKRQSALLWGCSRLADLTALSSTKDRVAVSVLDLKSERHAMLLPHRVSATLLVSYPDQKLADSYEAKLREKLGKTGPKWELDQVAERPPMRDRSINRRLYKALAQSAEEHNGVLKTEGSRWPSVAGLVPSRTACICGVGPITKDRGTPNEAVQRISIVQRTLLITDFLLRNA